MNDLLERLTSSCILYADDVKIWGPSDDPVTLQQNLFSLENWVSENGMVLNTSKCKVLPIYTPALNHYYLGGDVNLFRPPISRKSWGVLSHQI